MRTFIVINGKKIDANDIAEKFGMEDATHGVELLQETPSGTVRAISVDNAYDKHYGIEIYMDLPNETAQVPAASAIVSEHFEGSPLITSLWSRKSQIAEMFADMRPSGEVAANPKDPRITILEGTHDAVQVFSNSDRVKFRDDYDQEQPKFVQ